MKAFKEIFPAKAKSTAAGVCNCSERRTDMSHGVSRRSFFGGVAAALGYLGVGTEIDLFAQDRTQARRRRARPRAPANEYDTFAHLSSNENCWGPPESVMKAMNNAWKYSNRYGYPDGNIVQEIAKHHGVKPENILLTAGSGEVLDVVGTTFLPAGKKVLGVDAVLRLGLPARDQHQVGGDHAAARQGLPPEHPGDDQGGQRQRRAARVRLSVQPEQPDRR